MGASPVAFKFYFYFFELLVFILDFVHNWINLVEFGMRLCNKYNIANYFQYAYM